MPIGEIVNALILNLGITFPMLVVLLATLGSLIFMALELRFGLMMLFFMNGILTVIFWAAFSAGSIVTFSDLVVSITVTLASIVLMTLSLLSTRSKQVHGGII
jgi:hypothetical protein